MFSNRIFQYLDGKAFAIRTAKGVTIEHYNTIECSVQESFDIPSPVKGILTPIDSQGKEYGKKYK